MDWENIYPINKNDVLSIIREEKELLEKAATGTRIETISVDYITNHSILIDTLNKLQVELPNLFDNLWEWYSFYKDKFSHYYERREWINKNYAKLLETIKKSESSIVNRNQYVTGWDDIDNLLVKMRTEIVQAKETFDYQKVGLAARDLLIFLVRNIYNPEIHGVEYEGKTIGKDDDFRRIYMYIQYHLQGNTNEDKRKYVKSIAGLADNLTHKLDTGNLLDAELCYESIMIVWKEKIKEKFCCYFMSSADELKGTDTTTFNYNTVDFNHSVYIKSSMFDNMDLVCFDSSDQPTLLKNEEQRVVFRDLKQCVQDLIEKKFSVYMSAKADDEICRMINYRKTFPTFSNDA